MRKAVRSGSLLVLFILLIGGCGDDDGGTKPNNQPGNPVDYPLEVGNVWRYDVTMTEAGSTTTHARTDSIRGTVDFPGEGTYYLLESVTDGTDVDTTYFRQVGQLMMLRQPIPESGEDPYSEFLFEQLRASMPWKVADFTSTEGTSWTILQAGPVTIQIENQTAIVSLSFTAANMGRATLQVPSGTYEDVYRGRITQLITITVGGLPFNLTTYQDVYIRTGVGLVRDAIEAQIPSMTGGLETTTVRADLESFDLAE